VWVAATDAVGMGLNLAIRRIIFSETSKFDGVRRRPLSVSEIKQIGGRAGRYGGEHDGTGEVTCLEGGDIALIRRAMMGKVPPTPVAGILPSTEQLEVFGASLLPPAERSHALHRIRKRFLASYLRHRDTTHKRIGVDVEQFFDAESESDGGTVAMEDVRASLVKELHEMDHSTGDKGSLDVGDKSSWDPIVGFDSEDDEPERAQGDSVSQEVEAVNDDDDDAVDEDDESHLDEWILTAHASSHVVGSPLPFSRLLQLFHDHASVNERCFFLCEQQDVMDLARAIDHIEPITTRDRYVLCCTPLDAESPLARHAFVRWAVALSRNRRIRVGLRAPSHAPVTPHELRSVEDAHKVFDAYMWLARKWPERFVDSESCERRLEATESLIAEGLEEMGLRGMAEARRRMFAAQRSERAMNEARLSAQRGALLEDARSRDLGGEVDEAEDGRVRAMLAGELQQLRAAQRVLLGERLSSEERRRIQRESVLVRRLLKRVARRGHLSRKEAKAAALLLDGSLTEQMMQ
jgi:acylphosphatase